MKRTKVSKRREMREKKGKNKGGKIEREEAWEAKKRKRKIK